jgi:mxaJ protein
MYSAASKALITLLGTIAAFGSLAWRSLADAGPSPGVVATTLDRGLSREPLRVCADPNNLPFSNSRGEGFENAMARLVAHDLHRELTYTWWPQRRGFVRNTLKAGVCDLIMGVPAGFEMVEPTTPYYRSSYAFVTRADRHLDVDSFDDPRLRKLAIGVHTIGDDYANVPPAQALATRGIVGNVRGYSIYGDYSQPNPARALIDAVARGEIDVAIAWGPLAGYFAAREPVALRVKPVAPADPPDAGMTFAIAAGVRHGDTALRSEVQAVLDRRRDDIAAMLHDYHVPLLAEGGGV